MKGVASDEVRGLPHGGKTRDELKAQIEKHGSLAESEVLAHINRSARPVWNHNDFVNFFQKSCQMVFQVKNDRLHLALSDHDSSDEEDRDAPSSMIGRPQSKGPIDNFNRGMRDLGNGANSNSGSGERRRGQYVTTRPVPSSSSSDEDNNHAAGPCKPSNSGYLRPPPTKSSNPPPGFPPQRATEPDPFDSDEEDPEPPRLSTKAEVFRLVSSSKRNFRTTADIEKMVTMDPDPANKMVPRLHIGADDDSSNDSDDESSDADVPLPNSRIQPPPAQPAPQISSNAMGELQQPDTRTVAPRIMRVLSGQEPGFREKFFEVKENNDFRESRERDPEKILKDVMEFGRIPKNDAESYFDYFVLLQASNIEALSNGQLVAGILALVESDADGEMLRQIRESAEFDQ